MQIQTEVQGKVSGGSNAYVPRRYQVQVIGAAKKLKIEVLSVKYLILSFKYCALIFENLCCQKFLKFGFCYTSAKNISFQTLNISSKISLAIYFKIKALKI